MRHNDKELPEFDHIQGIPYVVADSMCTEKSLRRAQGGSGGWSCSEEMHLKILYQKLPQVQTITVQSVGEPLQPL